MSKNDRIGFHGGAANVLSTAGARLLGVGLLGVGLLGVLPARAGEAAAPGVGGGDTASILPGRPDADKPTAQEAQELGVPFESVAAGIAFSPPAHMKEIRGVPGDVIVRYVDDDRHWNLTVSKLNFERPVKLSIKTAAASDAPSGPGAPADTAGNTAGNPLANSSANPAADPLAAPAAIAPPASQPAAKGLLESMADQMKIDAPSAEILRQDVITIGGADVGMLAARYSVGPQTDLEQQAIFRVDDKNFYLFNLTVPAPRTGKVSDDPGVQNAVATFNSVLDTVRLLEQTAIREEQDQRLYHTRTLFLNLTPDKIRNALVKEQWLRLLKDGKDIGYSYVVEDVGRDLPRAGGKESQFEGGDEGPLIGIRSRSYPEPGMKVDAETWMWMSFDRSSEKWSNVAVIYRDSDRGGKGKRQTLGDAGSTFTNVRTVFDKDLIGHGEEIKPGEVDKNQPPFHTVNVHLLHVEYTGDQNRTPVEQEVPVFYIPQALGYLLPELVPRKPDTYMFASYVPEKRQVMARYMDVGAPDQYTIDGKSVTALAVRDRFGLEGAVTSNYLSPQGAYLGSISPGTKVQVLPTDAATLMRIWKDVNLSRPGAVPQSTPEPAPTATPESTPTPSADGPG